MASSDSMSKMRDVVVLFLHAIVTIVRLAQPGGLRAVVAESILVKHQLLILNRGRKRAPNLKVSDRVIAGLCALFIRRLRILRSAIVLKPSTLLNLHAALRTRKYQLLFSSRRGRGPGPKGPTKELVDAVVNMKRTESPMGMSQNRRADGPGLCYRNRQGRSPPDFERALPARSRRARSLLAHVSGSHKRQSMELRSIPLRIGHVENPLGSIGNGPIHAPYHRFWRPPRDRGWRWFVPDVPASDSRALATKVPELGS